MGRSRKTTSAVTPYHAANQPLQSLEELRLLEIWEDEFFDENGVPNELFAKLDSMVSVISTGATNINSCSGLC